MGHKVSRHKSYAVCRVDGLPGQYRPIRNGDTSDFQPKVYTSSYDNDGLNQGHTFGVTADRNYVTAIQDIGSHGIRRRSETKTDDVTSDKPKPKPRKKKDINSNENTNGDLPHHGQPKPAKRTNSQEKRKDVIPGTRDQKSKANGSAFHINSSVEHENLKNPVLNMTQDPKARVIPRAPNTDTSQVTPPTNGDRQNANQRVSSATTAVPREMPKKIVPRAGIPTVGHEVKDSVIPRVDKQSVKPNISDERHRETNPRTMVAAHPQQEVVPRITTTLASDDELIPVSNVDQAEMDKIEYYSGSNSTPTTLNNTQQIASVSVHTDDSVGRHKKQNVNAEVSNSVLSPSSTIKQCDSSYHTVVSVIVHKPYVEPTETPQDILGDDHQCLSDQEELEPGNQILFDDDTVDAAMFERVSSARSSQVKKSVAFSDDCIDIDHGLSQSYPRSGFHEKMDSVYGTGVKQNDGDKWVTLDGTDATDFALIQRQKIPGQSILKKTKYPPVDIPTLNLTEAVDESSEIKTNNANRSVKSKPEIDWDHIESTSYQQPAKPVPAPRGRLKGYHRPQNEEIAKLKASNGTLADYIKQKSTNLYQASSQVHLKPAANGVHHAKALQNGDPRPQSSRGYHGGSSPRHSASPRSASADPRGRVLSPPRSDVRGRVLVPDSHAHHPRKIANGYTTDPAVHHMQVSRGKDPTIMESRAVHRHPQQQQNVRVVLSNTKQKPTKTKQPRQQRSISRQQWMVGNL